MSKLNVRAVLSLGIPVVSLLAVGGCAPNPPAPLSPGTDHVVRILFDASGCPEDTMYNGTLSGFPEVASDKDTIRWQSYNADGTQIQQNQYKIFFDPFKNSSIDSQNDGGTQKKKTEKSSDIPTGVFYKYTIWAKTACPGKPKDPRFKVL